MGYVCRFPSVCSLVLLQTWKKNVIFHLCGIKCKCSFSRCVNSFPSAPLWIVRVTSEASKLPSHDAFMTFLSFPALRLPCFFLPSRVPTSSRSSVWRCDVSLQHGWSSGGNSFSVTLENALIDTSSCQRLSNVVSCFLSYFKGRQDRDTWPRASEKEDDRGERGINGWQMLRSYEGTEENPSATVDWMDSASQWWTVLFQWPWPWVQSQISSQTTQNLELQATYV